MKVWIDRVGGVSWRRWGAPVFVVVLGAALTACVPAEKPGAVQVTTQALPGVNFASYRTYDWVKPGLRVADPSGLSELERRDWSIRTAVDEELRARGMVVRSNQPSLLVDYQIDFKFKQTESFQDYREYRELGGKDEMSKANVFGYEEATLSIVLIDPQTGAPSWRGMARGVAYESELPAARLREAIRQIFLQMPLSQ